MSFACEFFTKNLLDSLPGLILSCQMIRCDLRHNYSELTDLEYRLYFGIPAWVMLKHKKNKLEMALGGPHKWRKWGQNA